MANLSRFNRDGGLHRVSCSSDRTSFALEVNCQEGSVPVGRRIDVKPGDAKDQVMRDFGKDKGFNCFWTGAESIRDDGRA